MRQKDYKNAQKYFEEALKSDDDNAVVLDNLALIALMQKNYTKAETETESLLKSYPNNEVLRWRMFLIYVMQKNFKSAQEIYEKMDKNGTTPSWYYATVLRHLIMRRYDEAVNTYSQSKVMFGKETKGYDDTLRHLGFLQ